MLSILVTKIIIIINKKNRRKLFGSGGYVYGINCAVDIADVCSPPNSSSCIH